MFFVITALIDKNALDIYAAATPAHNDYLESYRSQLLIAGFLVGDHEAPIGSLCILEADSLLSAAQFVEADPMTASGAVASIDIVEWRTTER